MLLSSGSMGWKVCSAARPSIIRDPAAMAYREEIRIRTPCLRTPMRNRGILSKITVIPTGNMAAKRLTIWATPVKPPIEMLFGWKNQLNDRA